MINYREILKFELKRNGKKLTKEYIEYLEKKAQEVDEFLNDFDNDELDCVFWGNNGGKGFDVYYNASKKVYYGTYGQYGNGFTDYDNIEKHTNKWKLIKLLRSLIK